MERTKARKQFLFDVFVTAIESGSYGVRSWGRLFEYRWSRGAGQEDLDGFRATVATHDDIDDDFPLRDDKEEDLLEKGLLFVIDAELLEKGFEKLRADPGQLACETMGMLLLADSTNGKWGDYDAVGADAVVQAGLFGHVVYG